MRRSALRRAHAIWLGIVLTAIACSTATNVVSDDNGHATLSDGTEVCVEAGFAFEIGTRRHDGCVCSASGWSCRDGSVDAGPGWDSSSTYWWDATIEAEDANEPPFDAFLVESDTSPPLFDSGADAGP